MQAEIVKVSARLSAHAGAMPITREALANLSTPPRTRSHYPFAHADLVTYMETRLWDGYGIEIVKGEFAVMSDGLKLFGVVTLKRGKDDFALALGIRTSNDRSMSLQFVAGANVFVCDNMAFSGDTMVLCRKHTGLLNPRKTVFDGIDTAIMKFASLENRIAQLKASKITDTEAKALIYDMVAKGVVNQNALPTIGKLYFEPTHQEQAKEFGGSLWMLNNAVTEYAKGLKPNVALDVAQGVGALMGM